MEPQPPSANIHNLAFVERLYADFLRDPESVDAEWRDYFDSIGRDDGASARLGPSFQPSSIFQRAAGPQPVMPPAPRDADAATLQERVDQLIHAYRVRGHLIAQVDPLGLPRPSPPELDPEFHGITDADMGRVASTEAMQGADVRPVQAILERLRNTYCRSIGAQFMHIDSLTMRRWLQHRMEGTENRLALTRAEQLRIFTRLTDAVVFEEFIKKKYIGAKSFSLEGAESLIPLLDLAIEKGGEQGLREIVLAMAHRGRLNVLANVMDKSPKQIFREFEDIDTSLYRGRGDVKYHLGHHTDRKTASGQDVHLSLCFNPSHLEFVNPVALGRVRAKQDRVDDAERQLGLALLIHGDAAFAGEGITQETLNLSQLDAYTVGGTLHVIVNNSIGFTTPPSQGRSCIYATDPARMLQVPIFHVNGEDPEAVAQVVRLALDFRMQFKRDVVIDMYCYRRQGHNESDEPSFTQPLLYRAIAQRKSVREGYLEHLLRLGGVTREEADRIGEERRAHLEADLSAARSTEYQYRPPPLPSSWSTFSGGADADVEETETGVSPERLARLLEMQTRLPENFHPNSKIERLANVRREMAAGKRPLDWSAAEALAIASLATEGYRVRLTGQDSERGTFSQRHAVLHDVEDGRTYATLSQLSPDQAPVEIVNSPLSETGVLGFEYGYSMDYPEALVMWEAQFGDFVNAAQVIVDQFIASAESKWRRLSGLVLLLPHGFEGQGPEHSSARLERFLALAAEDNMQIVNVTTPAQYFHLLRRQVLSRWRKPLVVMTPKSLLRHPDAVSNLDELGGGRFERIIPDRIVSAHGVSRVLACSGKIYYELDQQRRELNRDDVAIIRLEQLYPLRNEELSAALSPYGNGTPVFWVQEEPENMGAWRYLWARFGDMLFDHPFAGICRPAAASPATGSLSSHKLEQKAIMDAAFEEAKASRKAPDEMLVQARNKG